MKKSGVKASIIWYKVFYFRAISSWDMSTFVGIISQFSYNLSLMSHVFINFNENFNLIICILDHSVLILYQA